MRTKGKHINKDERNQIEILLTRGYTQKEIGRVLEIHKSTISREIKRHRLVSGIYKAVTAEHKSEIKRRNSKYQCMKIQKNTDLQGEIINALNQYQSPEAIAGRFGTISSPSIYKWLYSVFGQKYCHLLCSKRYRPKKKKNLIPKREMIKGAISIHERPIEGIHWEGDLFVSSSKLGHTVSIATFVEQKSQYVKAIRISNRKPKTMVNAVSQVVKNIKITDITLDRGLENKYHRQFPIPAYFCDPYSPWQKPHVENNIGLLRKWFVPKKTDLKCMSQKELTSYVNSINQKWRKSLGYRSAEEVARECGIIR